MTKHFDSLVEKLELKIARGFNRQHLTQIPAIARTKILKKNYRPQSKGTLGIIQNAKKSLSGIWRLTKQQVVDVANKYHFTIPTEERPTRKLGTTGITLYRKGPGIYFLLKRTRR